MKTTKFFLMAALALTFAACSNDDNDILNPAQTAKGEGITITATLAPKSGSASMRKVTDGTDKIVAEWADHEGIAILYTVGSTKYKADATITSVDANGVATITFTVESGTPDNTECTLVYPKYAAKTDYTGVKDYATLLAEQWGNLTADFDVRVGAGKIQTTTPGLDVTTQPAAQYSIFKFTTQNIAGTGITPSKFKVSDSEGNVITTVSPSSSSAFYVALPALSAGTYWFSATADSKPYIAKGTVGTATTAGNYYQTTVKMATIGDVILSDGKFAARSSTTGTNVAMIAYVGSDNGEAAPYNHGLALALSDANVGNSCKWSTSYTKVHTYNNPSKDSFASESGLQYNATQNSDTYPAFKAAIANNGTAAPTDCSSWFLASGYQWNKMIDACKNVLGTKNTYEDLRDGFNGIGGTNMQSSEYWSSTERGSDNPWDYDFEVGDWDNDLKNNPFYVRACLAF